VILDGALIPTGRIRTSGPTAGVDLWWSGKHKHLGGNIHVFSTADGWPPRTSKVHPGREHDTTAARADPVLLERIRDWADDGALALADLEYESDTLRVPIKKTAGTELTVDQQSYDTVCPRRPALPR
jgi:hypothetical protein